MDKLKFKEHSDLVSEIAVLQAEREGICSLRSQLQSPGLPKNDGMPRSCKAYHDGMAQGVSALVDRIKALDNRIEKLLEHNANMIERNIARIEEIEQMVKMVDDPCKRQVLWLRYVDSKKWEDIAEEMNYSRQSVIDKHNAAMKGILKRLY